MDGSFGNLVLVTHGRETEGFPALLNEMLWRGNYSSRPEYAVYARGFGPGMVSYLATLHIPMRPVESGSEPHDFSAHGTSIEMAIQEVAYLAMTNLRRDVPGLEVYPFTHFPIQGFPHGVNTFERIQVGDVMYDRRMSELVRAQDRMIRCFRAELMETRRRYNVLNTPLSHL